jgi:hypothetical protein
MGILICTFTTADLRPRHRCVGLHEVLRAVICAYTPLGASYWGTFDIGPLAHLALDELKILMASTGMRYVILNAHCEEYDVMTKASKDSECTYWSGYGVSLLEC